MSYYDDSSLFVAPNGYKTSVLFAQKPMDANGQLAFTRSNDTATRVADNGLIEKVRTNRILQSNSFSTTWTASNASVTSGQAGYDGTNNAWLLSKSAAQGYISQGPASSGSETISVYAKAGTDNWLYILVRDSASVFFGGYWDLQNGVVGSATGATTLRIQSVGNGWYRCSASFAKSTSNYYRIYPAEGNNDTSGTSGNILIQAAQLETGDIATDYIATTTAAVSVGPVANTPRIDYTGGGCGKLLLEPQRTNLALFSEQFDNAAWSKTGVGVTANNSTSPDGNTNADKLFNSVGTTGFASQTISLVSSTIYSGSVFAKNAGRDSFFVLFSGSGGSASCTFNLTTLTTTPSGGVTAKIEDYGGGWYRCSVVFTATSTGASAFRIYPSLTTGDGTSGIFIYGAQLEAGSYPSSYVNTLGAAGTRGADACSKTGISSLIGQTQGTIFVEGAFAGIDPANTRRIVSLSDGTTSNSVLIQNTSNSTTMQFVIVNGGATQVTITKSLAITFGQTFKAAFAYKENDFVAYINGEQVGIDILGTVPATSKFAFDRGNATTAHEGTINEALLFKTRLPNSELASLTNL